MIKLLSCGWKNQMNGEDLLKFDKKSQMIPNKDEICTSEERFKKTKVCNKAGSLSSCIICL